MGIIRRFQNIQKVPEESSLQLVHILILSAQALGTIGTIKTIRKKNPQRVQCLVMGMAGQVGTMVRIMDSIISTRVHHRIRKLLVTMENQIPSGATVAFSKALK